MIDLTRAHTTLAEAKTLYEKGDFHQAICHTTEALSHYHSIADLHAQSSDTLMEYLDAVTLHQSLLVLLNRPTDYLSFTPYVKELIYLLFEEHADFYYATSLFDTCETMAIHHLLTEAKYYKKLALTLLWQCYGDCPYYRFMDAYCDAQIAFYMEDYYSCIDAAQKTNSLWYSEEYGQVTPPITAPDKEFATNIEQAIDHLGINNSLLLCNAYGKINNPKESILFLEDCLKQKCFDAAQTTSAEITLAELYVINGQKESALPLYEKYKSSNFANHPGLAAALVSLSYFFETEPSAFAETLSSNKYCYSHDMFTVSQYNYGLALTSAGDYHSALMHFKAIGGHGYSMLLTILAMQNNTAEIDNLKETVNTYFYRQINQIVAHYNEELAFNHLAKLQYHIDLTLGAYCHPTLPVSNAYDFLLNTKYIALETSVLLRSAKPERSLYSTEQIQSRLPSDTLLLEYTCIRTLDTMSYGVFVVSDSNITYVPLSDTSSIDQLIDEWLQLLKESVRATGEAALSLPARMQNTNSKLRKALFLPIKPYITTANHLLIAPAGSLIHFPFSQLSCSAGAVLGDSYAITYINTGKELCNHAQNTLGCNAPNALVIGNPKTCQWPNLPFAETEADMVSYFLHTKARKKEDATLANILHSLQNAPSILHIAAHGVYHETTNDTDIKWEQLYQTMTQSGIVLADDALLSCAHIGTLNLSATRLAVLSCCHSAKGTFVSTEGVYGLRRAFCVAGCDTIIANLWQVDDTVSCMWMQTFYQMVTIGGASYREAFISATDTVRNYEKNGTFPYANPYYWAGFILVQAP